MSNEINNLPSLIEKSNAFKYQKKNFPFMFAEGRAFQAPTLEYKGDTSFFEEKNAVLAINIKMKFIVSVIESDADLNEILNNRNANSDTENSDQ